jgi:hypothetical protein
MTAKRVSAALHCGPVQHVDGPAEGSRKVLLQPREAAHPGTGVVVDETDEEIDVTRGTEVSRDHRAQDRQLLHAVLLAESRDFRTRELNPRRDVEQLSTHGDRPILAERSMLPPGGMRWRTTMMFRTLSRIRPARTALREARRVCGPRSPLRLRRPASRRRKFRDFQAGARGHRPDPRRGAGPRFLGRAFPRRLQRALKEARETDLWIRCVRSPRSERYSRQLGRVLFPGQGSSGPAEGDPRGDAMSITTEPELVLALEQVEKLEKGLLSLRRELPKSTPGNLALLSEGPLDQIAQLQADIQEYALRTRRVDYIGMRLVGPRIHLRETPVSILTAVLDAFRKGVQAIAELEIRGQRSNRPTAELKRLCDFQILALAPGSLRVLMALPDEEKGLLPGADPNPASVALDDYLKAAAWAASDEDLSQIGRRFPQEHLRKALLSELQRVVPRPRGELELVEFSGPRIESISGRATVGLERATRTRLNSAIDNLVHEESQTHDGVLREIDLDSKTFALRNPGALEQKQCRFEDELIDAAKEALDKRVQVTGLVRVDPSKRGQASLSVTRLEIIEDDSERDM